jgi:ribosomal protein L22
MTKQEILDIAKELILITAKYKKNINESKKQKLLNVFSKYENKLKKEETKYAQTILSFVVDLKNDLISGKKLNIDKISTDEYLENYLLTKNELMIYNSLILKESYRKIFDELNKEKKDTKIIEKNLEKLIKNFINNSKKLNTKIIAQNLLIFTSFERTIAKKYLINLYNHLTDINHKRMIFSLIEQYNISIFKIKEY